MSNTTTARSPITRAPDGYARMAGVFLLLTAAATVAMVGLRVAGDTDQATLIESLRAIAEDRGTYAAGGAARFISGVTLLVAAWGLSRTGTFRNGLGAPVVSYLFGAAGIITAVSGACAVLLAAYHLPEASVAIPAWVEATATLRWLTGKVGFALAGAALIVGAWRQWRAGETLMKAALASAAIGVAMQLIWIDPATIMHRIVGVAFFLWLIAVGTMLATGRAQRHFSAEHGGVEEQRPV